jgi:hypothetical protein
MIGHQYMEAISITKYTTGSRVDLNRMQSGCKVDAKWIQSGCKSMEHARRDGFATMALMPLGSKPEGLMPLSGVPEGFLPPIAKHSQDVIGAVIVIGRVNNSEVIIEKS